MHRSRVNTRSSPAAALDGSSFFAGDPPLRMVDHISREQTEAWLDEKVVQGIEHETTDGAEFNLQLQLSRLPLHVIKEETWGPLRVVGECTFDTERVAALVEDDEDRQELLVRLSVASTVDDIVYRNFYRKLSPFAVHASRGLHNNHGQRQIGCKAHSDHGAS